MANFIGNVEINELDFFDTIDGEYLNEISGMTTSGTYIKLPTQELILIDLGNAQEIISLNKTDLYGYSNNKEIIEIMFDNEV